jgi:hypothetical protein
MVEDKAKPTKYVKKPRYGTFNLGNFTAKNWTVPAVYGEQWLPGAVLGWDPNFGGNVTVGYLFALGEQDLTGFIPATWVKLNDKLWGLSAIGQGGSEVPGDASGTNATFDPLIGDGQSWPGYMRVNFWFDPVYLSNQFSGLPTVLVKTLGQKVFDWRDVGQAIGTRSTWEASTNPIVIAADIHHNAWHWEGRDFSILNEDNWTDWADWCDEVMSDDTKRWEFCGQIRDRKADAVVDQVLQHCFARRVDYAGQIFIVGHKLPPALSGTWTASASATLTGTSGNATNEIEAGDMLMFKLDSGTWTDAEVVSVGGANSITIDTAVTITDATLRKMSNVHIDVPDLMDEPIGKDLPQDAVPNYVVVNFVHPDTQKSIAHTVQIDATPPDEADAKISHVHLVGIKSESHAERVGRTLGYQNKFAPNGWSIVVRPGVAGLFLGEVFRVTLGDGTDKQWVTALDRTDNDDGTVSLFVEEFDPQMFSEDIAASGTPISIGADPPDVPDSATQRFLWTGPWEEETITDANGDPDNITSWSVYLGSLTSSTYYADLGDGEPGTRVISQYAEIDLEWDNADWPIPPLNANKVCITGMVRCTSYPDTNCYLQVKHLVDSGGGYAVTLTKPITPPTTGKWIRFCYIADGDCTTVGTSHKLRFAWNNYSAQGDITWEFRRVMVGPLEFDLDPGIVRGLPIGGGVVGSLGIRERWEWVEDSNAIDTVLDYFAQLVKVPPLLLGSTPEGTTFLEFSVPRSVGDGPPTGDGMDGDTVRVGHPYLFARGYGGDYLPFPAPTQALHYGTPAVPTSADQYFGEAGDWESRTMLPDPDDFSASQGWTVSGLTATYDGTNEWTKIDVAASSTGTVSYDVGLPDVTVPLLVTFLAKSDSDVFQLYYDGFAATEQGTADVLDDDQWRRYAFIVFPTAISNNKVGISAQNSLGGSAESVYVKRGRVVPWVLTPGLALYERWSWTITDASTVIRFELFESDNAGIVLDSVPSSVRTMEHTTLLLGHSIDPAGAWWGNDNAIETAMRSVGYGGQTMPFPSATQYFETRAYGGTIEEQLDANFTSLATGDLMIYNATSGEWENDTLDDSDIDLSGTHTGLLSELSGTGSVAGAMTVLDDLQGSDIDIDDEDVDVTGGYSNLLSGDTTLDAALDTIDALSIEMPTRQQVMNGSKSSVTDNTSTTIVTFTMPTGPSSLAVGLTFVGESASSTDTAKVVIQGWLMAVRNSTGTVTAEWVETFNDDKATGSVTLGTNEADVTVATADCQMKLTFDSSLNTSWTVKWTALMSNDVTVTAA